MKILNICCFQKWPLRDFIVGSITIQLSLIILIAYNECFIEIPYVRELLGFVYITFIPGFLILRYFRLDSLDSIQSILLSVSLSLGYSIICGYLLNIVGPLLGITKPMSTKNVLVLMISLSIIMSVLCYINEKRKGNHTINQQTIYRIIDIDRTTTIKAIFICHLPVLAITGTFLMNTYNNNVLLIITLILIALIPLLISLNRLPQELYGLSIFMSSISLLFHTSLISDYLWGWDIHFEYFVSNNVLTSQLWDPASAQGLNSLLLLTIVAPIYSQVMGLNLQWVFKIVFPFLFSLVPLALYQLYAGVFKNKYLIALSPFFFMFFYGFFKSMPDKQMIAELFLVLIIYIIIMNKIVAIDWRAIILILSFTLIVSHYGVSWLFLIMLTFIACLIHLDRRFINNATNNISNNTFNQSLNLFCVMFGVLVVIWYYLTASGSNFTTIVNLGASVTSNLVELIQEPSVRSGIGYATTQMPTALWRFYKLPFFILIGFITMGMFITTFYYFTQRKSQISAIYFFISLFFYCFMMVSVFLTLGLGMDRAVQISLLTLSPFTFIGLNAIVQKLKDIGAQRSTKDSKEIFEGPRVSAIIIAIFLLVFLLLNSGVIFELTKDPYPPLFAINKTTDFPVFTSAEHSGAAWLLANKNSEGLITDDRGQLLLAESIWKDEIKVLRPKTESLEENRYIYLGKYATEEVLLGDTIVGFNREHIPISKTTVYNKVLSHKSIIYYSGKSKILV